jgi:hypothetical protein
VFAQSLFDSVEKIAAEAAGRDGCFGRPDAEFKVEGVVAEADEEQFRRGLL